MNSYFKICTAMLLVFSTHLFSETLLLEKNISDNNFLSCIIEDGVVFLIGDLIDVYGETVEINGKILYRNYIDTLVVTEITDGKIIFGEMWVGAAQNLENGFILSKAERNIEREIPFIESKNRIKPEESEESEEPEEPEEPEELWEPAPGISIGIEGGIDYSIFGQLGAGIGVSINFGNNSINSGVYASISDFGFFFLDLTYTYNFPIHKNFALFTGAGSVVVLEFKTDYNLNILNGVGVTVDAGIKWVTGINLNISLKASYYGVYSFQGDSFSNTVYFGASIAYISRRLF